MVFTLGIISIEYGWHQKDCKRRHQLYHQTTDFDFWYDIKSANRFLTFLPNGDSQKISSCQLARQKAISYFKVIEVMDLIL